MKWLWRTAYGLVGTMLTTCVVSAWIAVGYSLWSYGTWGTVALVTLFVVQLLLLVFETGWGALLLTNVVVAGLVLHFRDPPGHWVAVLVWLLSLNLVVALIGLAATHTLFGARLLLQLIKALGGFALEHGSLNAAMAYRHVHVPISALRLSESYRAQEDPPLSAEEERLVDAFVKHIRLLRPRRQVEDGQTLLETLGKHTVQETAIEEPCRSQTSESTSAVDCSVFAPREVQRNGAGLLQVFLHAPEDRQAAEATAVMHDDKAVARGRRSLLLNACKGTTFFFEVEIGDFKFNDPTCHVIWTGQPQAATFAFSVPGRCRYGVHGGTVRVFKDGRPIGRIDFQVAVTRTGTQTGVVPVGDDAKFYRRCFCSYSSKDRTEALKRVQGLRAAGLDAFVDVLTLRPGDRWNDEIFSAIDESDLFVLIWSSNARESKWVRREVRYAVRRFKQRRSPDFHPIPIEGPPIPSVPRSLRCYHFNDVLLQIIHLAETTERELEDVVHPKAGNPRLIDWSS